MPLSGGEGGGGRRLMTNTILNFHFDYLHTSLTWNAASVERFENLTCHRLGSEAGEKICFVTFESDCRALTDDNTVN